MAATVYFFGQATASLVAGLIGDNFGRKLPVLVFGILVILASFLASYTTNYTVYSALDVDCDRGVKVLPPQNLLLINNFKTLFWSVDFILIQRGTSFL